MSMPALEAVPDEGLGGREMPRLPEPELMEGEEQASEYAHADFSELHEPMLAKFRACFEGFAGRLLLDLGCGSADMSIRFAGAYPQLRVLGIDGSEPMLRLGREAVRAKGLERRVTLERRYLPDTSLPSAAFDAVTANSLLHHLPGPMVLWETARKCAKPGAPVMVMDLRRPRDPETARRLVARHGMHARPALRQDFFNSLRAAYTAWEVRMQLEQAGLGSLQVEEADDLHLLIWGTV